MKIRFLTAAVALPILAASIILPAVYPAAVWLFVAIAGFAFAAGLFEFFTITKTLQLKGDAAAAYIGSAGIFIAFLADVPDLKLMAIAAFVIGLLISQTFRFAADFSKMLTGMGVTILGVMYVTFMGSFLVAIRLGFENSPKLSTQLLAYFFLVLMGSDTGAYAFGRLAGKHQLAPKISPAKTWEGFFGGVITAAVFGAFATLVFFPELPLTVSVPLAIVMAVTGVFGDLAESAMKRGADKKDTARTLPGHGGLLDRLDSLLLNAPILYYFARFYFT